MADSTEDIKKDLDQVVRLADAELDRARLRLSDKLEGNAAFSSFDIENLMLAQASQTLAAWIRDSYSRGHSPEHTLQVVRSMVILAVFRQDQSSSSVSRSMDEHQRTVFARFIKRTDGMLD